MFKQEQEAIAAKALIHVRWFSLQLTILTGGRERQHGRPEKVSCSIHLSPASIGFNLYVRETNTGISRHQVQWPSVWLCVGSADRHWVGLLTYGGPGALGRAGGHWARGLDIHVVFWKAFRLFGVWIFSIDKNKPSSELNNGKLGKVRHILTLVMLL